MGQRLNIEIFSDRSDSLLANCYYHWSAFSLESLKIVQELINLMEIYNISIDVLGSIKLLEMQGASFSWQEFEAAKKQGIITGEYFECKGRNKGLISVTEKGMRETRLQEEGRVSIYFAEKTIDFSCCDKMTELNDEDILEKIKPLFYVIPKIRCSYSVDFNKITDLIAGIEIAENAYSGRFIIGNDCFRSIY